MTRTCALCGAEADDHIRNEDLDIWWCAEPWGCLTRAAGLDRHAAGAAQ